MKDSNLIGKKYNIENNLKKSCGCLSKKILRDVKRLKKGQSGLNSLYNHYRLDAKRRDLEFELTKEEFEFITSQNCFYCGKEPSAIKKEYNCSEEGKEYSKYIYNGIDRVDNTKGYILDNCVPCCRIHNEWKRAMKFEEFVKNIHKTSETLKLKGII